MRIAATYKLAVSSLIVALLAIGCSPGTGTERVRTVSAVARKHTPMVRAISEAERAVALAPRDAGRRQVLAELYLKNGRFESAAVTFSDVVALDPANGRAGLHRALALSALGEYRIALAQLDLLGDDVPAADQGLAYALSGDPLRGVELLLAAARKPGADARTRQNLALAYALDGSWEEARAVAAQDVSPAELDQRMFEWAAFARPSAPHEQVAWMLGVKPVLDPGQPVALALQLPPQAPARAEAVAPEAVEQAAEAAVVSEAEAEPIAVEPVASAAAEAPAPEIVLREGAGLAAVAAEVAQAAEPLLHSSSAPASLTPVVSRFAAQPAPGPVSVAPLAGFVVQLGAFNTAAMAEAGWAEAQARLAGLGEFGPAVMQVTVNGRAFHRLSVTGFATQGEAQLLCRLYQAAGGQCFARAAAGDQPVWWAARRNGTPG